MRKGAISKDVERQESPMGYICEYAIRKTDLLKHRAKDSSKEMLS